MEIRMNDASPILEFVELKKMEQASAEKITQSKKDICAPDIKLLSHAELMNYELPAVPWLVNGLIRHSSINVLAGKSSTLKSWLSLVIANSLSLGITLFGKFTVNSGAVLFLDRENHFSELKNRQKMILNGLGVDLQPKTFFISESNVKLDNPNHLPFLEKIISENKICLMIVDVYRRLISFDENDANEVSRLFVDLLKPLVERTGVSILLIHHEKKGDGSGDKLDRLRGSSDLSNYVDSVLQVNRKGSILQIEQTKNRSALEIEKFELRVETDEESYFKFLYSGETQDLSLIGQFCDILLTYLKTEKLVRFDSRLCINIAASNNLRRSLVFEALSELQNRGIIERNSRGNYTLLDQTKIPSLELVRSPLYKSGGLTGLTTQRDRPISPNSLNGLTGLTGLTPKKEVIKIGAKK